VYTPQTNSQANAASHADPTSEKGGGDAADTSHLADRGTAGAAANGYQGPSPDSEQIAPTAPPPDPLSITDDPSVQLDTDVCQQGNGITPSDRGKETRTSVDALHPAGTAAGQKQPSGTASQA